VFLRTYKDTWDCQVLVISYKTHQLRTGNADWSNVCFGELDLHDPAESALRRSEADFLSRALSLERLTKRRRTLLHMASWPCSEQCRPACWLPNQWKGAPPRGLFGADKRHITLAQMNGRKSGHRRGQVQQAADCVYVRANLIRRDIPFVVPLPLQKQSLNDFFPVGVANGFDRCATA